MVLLRKNSMVNKPFIVEKKHHPSHTRWPNMFSMGRFHLDRRRSHIPVSKICMIVCQNSEWVAKKASDRRKGAEKTWPKPDQIDQLPWGFMEPTIFCSPNLPWFWGVFMVDNLGFWWPKLLFFMVLEAHSINRINTQVIALTFHHSLTIWRFGVGYLFAGVLRKAKCQSTVRIFAQYKHSGWFRGGQWKGHVIIVMDKIPWQPVENQVEKYENTIDILPFYKFIVFVSLLSIQRRCLGSPLVGFSIIVRYRAASRQNAFPWLASETWEIGGKERVQTLNGTFTL